MAVQTVYPQPAAGVAGLILDTANRTVVSRAASGGDGTIQFGVGVKQGSAPGLNVVANDGTGTAQTFEGVTAYGVSQERKYPGGGTVIWDGASLNVLQQGRLWVLLSTGETPVYGDPVFWADDGTFSATSGVALNARFIGEATTDGIAPAEFFGGLFAEATE